MTLSNRDTEATNRKFHVLFSDTAVLREDLRSLKKLLAEHELRLERLEKKSAAE